MKEEDFDKILKNEINSQIKAPEKLKARISKEINQTENKKSHWIKTMQGIAAVVVVAALSVTSYAAITGNLSLEKLGFLKASKNYEENATKINKTIENEYLKYTLDNIACDDTYLIKEYTIDLKDNAIEKYGNVEYDEYNKEYKITIDQTQYINDKEIYFWGCDVEKITDKQFKMLEIYSISDCKESSIKFLLNINEITINSTDNSINAIPINKQISMDIEKKEKNNTRFSSISQTVGNKTFVIKEAANTNFETIIKASIITEESYDEYLKEEEGTQYDSFMVTQENGESIPFEVSENLNTYVITNDGSKFTTNDLYDYMSNQKEVDNLLETIDGDDWNNIKDSDSINGEQIIEKYGKNQNLKSKVVKIQRNYTIKIGSNEENEDVKKIKILPVKKSFINDRTDEELKCYNEAKWYKLKNKSYTATSELGGTLEISSIDITDEEIIFNYNTQGLIGEEALILMRQNNGEFNYFYPEKTETKGLSSTENKMIFYRKNNMSASSTSYNISLSDTSDMLDDISKDEFTMLFGKKNGTSFIGDGIIFDIPDKITNKIIVKNIQIIDVDSDNNTIKELDGNEVDDNNMFDKIDDDNSLFENINGKSKITLEEYSTLLKKTKRDIQNINSKGEKFDKNTAALSGIRIGSTVDDVHKLLKEKPEYSEFDDDGCEEYSDGITIVYELKNNKYCVKYIFNNGRLKTNTNIQVGDSVQKVIENNAKDNKLININENLYNKGWVLYGGTNAAYIGSDEGDVKNSSRGKKAYYLVSNYSDDSWREDYESIEIIYFDDDVCMRYSITNGIVDKIELSSSYELLI